MPRHSDARQRAVSTTAGLLQEQGYAGTGLTQILEASGAPKGSFYFHFPDGKEQLAAEALRQGGEQVAAALRRLADSTSCAAELIERFVTAEAQLLADSGYRQGCPIATVALEMAAESEPIRLACQQIFKGWIDTLTDLFADELGPRARDFAEQTVIALEGGLLLSRVSRDTGPLLRVRDRLVADLERISRPRTEESE